MAARQASGTNQIHPIYVVSGPEAFLKRQAMQATMDRVLGDADRSLALTEYDGASAGTELAEVLDDLRTLPFLADRRLVMVREADTFITRHREGLEDYLDSPSPTGVLLLECKSFPATTRLYKRAAAIGQVTKCESPKSNQVSSWLISRARDAHGVKLETRAAALIAAQIGDDLGILDNELQKLALYVGDRKAVAVADVEALVGSIREEKVWGLLSAIAAGDEAGALAIWEQVWETDRAAEGRAVGGIAYKVRQLLTAKRAQEAGASMPELAKILMTWGDDQRLRAELGAFTTSQVESMLCRLLQADVASKSGLASVRSSVESIIVDVCRARRARRSTG